MFLLALLPAVISCSTVEDENVVNIYNWADYIDQDMIDIFEQETGIKVNYDTYDSAEIVDVKLLTGNTGYDVVVHSNSFASRLVKTGAYQKIDTSRLENYRNLDPVLLERLSIYEVVAEYNVPYHWGATGYAWDVDMVRERLGDDFPMDGANILFDPEIMAKLADCGVSFLDSPTDVFPMLLAWLGRDPTVTSAENTAAAEDQMKKVRPYIRYFSGTKMLSDLPNREVCVAMSWSGDYATAAARAAEAGIDIDLRYTMPKEGSGLWADGLYITADAPHLDNAYRFIDFLLRADVARANSVGTNYGNANAASWTLMEPGFRGNRAIYPNDEDWEIIFATVPASPIDERVRTRAWARVRSGM